MTFVYKHIVNKNRSLWIISNFDRKEYVAVWGVFFLYRWNDGVVKRLEGSVKW